MISELATGKHLKGEEKKNSAKKRLMNECRSCYKLGGPVRTDGPLHRLEPGPVGRPFPTD